MKQATNQQDDLFKVTYEEPQMEIIRLSHADIIATSGDPDQGEWDPQN